VNLLDLPWSGAPVHIEMQVRRFRCITPERSHQYFTERVTEIARTHFRSGYPLSRSTASDVTGMLFEASATESFEGISNQSLDSDNRKLRSELKQRS
jgi:hypothetical protein